jgi:hypothetical protein
MNFCEYGPWEQSGASPTNTSVWRQRKPNANANANEELRKWLRRVFMPYLERVNKIFVEKRSSLLRKNKNWTE